MAKVNGRFALLVKSMLLLSAPAHAFDNQINISNVTAINNSQNIENTANFGNSGTLNASALGATIAASNINFQMPAGATYGGNTVTNTGNGAFGIMAINQNTGINSNVQQSITVKTGDITMTTTAK